MKYFLTSCAIWLIPLICLADIPAISIKGDCNTVANGHDNVASNGCVTEKTIKMLNGLLLEGRGRKLFVMEAALVPSPGFMYPEGHDNYPNEQTFIHLKVRNITTQPILLTAATFEIVNAKGLTKGGGMRGDRVLLPLISLSMPIVVNAGEDASLDLGEALLLRGIIQEIESSLDLGEAVVVGPEHNILANREFAPRLAKILANLFGERAQLNVIIYENDYHPVAKFALALSRGGDMFSKSEEGVPGSNKLVYQPVLRLDSFIAGYLKSKELLIPGFHPKYAVPHCIGVTLDSHASGGMAYKDIECDDTESMKADKKN